MPASRLRSFRHTLSAGVAAAALLLVSKLPVLAQTANDLVAQRVGNQQGRLVVEAEQVVYDNDNNRVEARGNVQLYYQGRALEADRVIYDRNTRRVYAEGNTKLTEPNGQVVYAQRFDLTDDFRDGFIDSLNLVSPDRQRFSAARAERTSGEVMVFERGTYTACEPCKDNPERPPLWQVKAARIIHNNTERMIYYENASLEFFGLPVAWAPFASAPDPTVTRKSGLLAPRYFRKGTLGYGLQLPIYWAIAPNVDLLFTPTLTTRQGVLGQVEWRHRLETGIYNIRAAGIFQQDSAAFLGGPFGPNYQTFVFRDGVLDRVEQSNRSFRGSIETTGKFLINRQWNFGWDLAASTDKFFYSQYKVRTATFQNNFLTESISQVNLTGQSRRSFFDLRGFHFRGLTAMDWQKQLPVVHPVLDFNRRFTPSVLGGELEVDVNVTSLSRDIAHFQGLPPPGQRFASQRNAPNLWSLPRLFNFRLGTASGSLYDACAVYERGQCLVRGLAGTMTRASTSLQWRRDIIDPIGQIWTPVMGLRADSAHVALSTSRFNGDPSENPLHTVFGNNQQRRFFGGDTEYSVARVMPMLALQYRFPLVASDSVATHVVEPIAQIVARPNETRIGRFPNEDAQSFIFDDTNLFAFNKFSGYDRVEGGVRANVGVRYTGTFHNGTVLQVAGGQSYHLAGRNSFATRDLINTGIDSGLDKPRSDYVVGTSIAPGPTSFFAARARFDETSLKLKRLDLQSNVQLGPLTTSVTYSRYDAQPELGFIRRREGLSTGGSLRLGGNWTASGSVLFDLDRYLADRDLVAVAPDRFPRYDRSPFRIAALGLGLSYVDECTTFSVSYSRSINDALGARRTNAQTFLLRLELRHLGQVTYQQRVNPVVDDGLTR